MLLNCHTCYSFGYGVLTPEQLLQYVKSQGYYSLALTDINNTSAVIDTIRLAAEQNIKAVAGVDFRNGIDQQYIVIAQNNFGFKEINDHLSAYLHNGQSFPAQAPEFYNCYVIYPLQKYRGQRLREHEFIGVAPHELAHIPFSKVSIPRNKMTVLQSATFAEKRHFNAHRLLRAIELNILLSKLSAQDQESFHTIHTRNDIYRMYGAYPEAIRNTEYILQNSHISFEYGKFANKNLKYYTQSLYEDMELLRVAASEGIKYRYPLGITPTIQQRLDKELDVIERMNFASYFLINWDIVKYAQHKDYFYVGRGSGANSLVAYLLRITDVDPIELDLYFERFINPHRSNPPDFDIDFSWTDRDDITRYIFDRFGRERTALLGTYNTFQHDAVIRELGKVFGLPPAEIDKLQSFKHINEVDQLGQLVLQYSHLLQGKPSHLSIHSSGILISEEPITTYTATFIPPKGYPTTQFSMLEAEDIGLYKFDILSQRGLGKIKDTVKIIRDNRNVAIDIHQVAKFKQDNKVRSLLESGRCIGCFYIESPAMRMLLTKLKANDYIRLVAASSIIRPGVSKSGMMREYIQRYRDEAYRKQAQDALPELYHILEETYGVMVYQEDVIKVAHEFAGLDLAQADYLRRGMSWKFKQRNEFHIVKQNFFDNCIRKGYPHHTIDKIWMQIESFANYAFSKGHSASYAVESFQALYLKAYYPLEYITATLINGGGFYRPEFYVHEARMHGGIITAPCINNGYYLEHIEGNVIYLGLSRITHLEQKLAEYIISERQQGGPYTSMANLIQRVPISLEQLSILIRIGALRCFDTSKKKLLWEAHLLIPQQGKTNYQNELFSLEPKDIILPPLHEHWIDDAYDEIELLGFPLCDPFTLIKGGVHNHLCTRDLSKYIHQTVEIIAYLCTVKPTTTSRKERMCFGTFIDQKGDWLDTVHFPISMERFPFRGPGCYRIVGKVTTEFDHISIEVEEMHKLDLYSRMDIVDMKIQSLKRQ